MTTDDTEHRTLDHTDLDRPPHSPPPLRYKHPRNKNKHRRNNTSHYDSRGYKKQHLGAATQTPSQTVQEITEAYLSTSLQPSRRISHPTRKLLVLDLNGTLLYRLRPQSRPFRSTYQIYSDASPAPSRTTYPRPYLPSFRQYLFHPVTRRWLDVMVWSSAQPHSVRDMLRLCFPREEGQPAPTETGPPAFRTDDRFFAVWARDTLGLSQADYSRKVQTTKNLEKVWTETSSRIPPPPELLPILHTSDDNDISSNSESNSSPVDLEHTHSSLSTLLLDDSPLKARLQPWNHLCVQEYDESSWKENIRVVKSWSRSRSQKTLERISVSPENDDTKNTETEVVEVEKVTSITDTLEYSEEKISNGEFPTGRPLSELQENERPEQTDHLPNPSDPIDHIDGQQPSSNPTNPLLPSTSPLESTSDSDTSVVLDETLLAAIGILEELKYQSNVCSWLRNRGPWTTINGEDTLATRTENDAQQAATGEINAETLEPSSTPEKSSCSQSSTSYCDVMSFSSQDIQDMPIPGLSQSLPNSNPNSQSISEASVNSKRRHSHFEEEEEEDILVDIEVERQRQRTKRMKLSDGFASVPSSSSSSMTPSVINSSPSSFQEPNFLFNSLPPSQFWFQDKDVFAHWVKQGRRALRELEIDELHGVEASS